MPDKREEAARWIISNFETYRKPILNTAVEDWMMARLVNRAIDSDLTTDEVHDIMVNQLGFRSGTVKRDRRIINVTDYEYRRAFEESHKALSHRETERHLLNVREGVSEE
jgi:hypothetical protein